jgi:23S rRNA (adenine2503-C2)-methyltransferase
MNDKDGMGVAARRITVSTAGVIPGIEKFKNLGLQVNLSISLHAADNKLRNMLMSVNKKYPLEKLVKTCEDFIQAGGRMLTLEYILIRGVNDSFEDADKLANIACRLNAKVNLIPCSPVPGLSFRAPDKKSVVAFERRLIHNSVNATMRESKGSDILASCGQLAGSV